MAAAERGSEAMSEKPSKKKPQADTGFLLFLLPFVVILVGFLALYVLPALVGAP